MIQKFLNIGANSLKRQNFKVMTHKVLIRMKERPKTSDSALAKQWAADHAQNFENYLQTISPELWQETQNTCKDFAANAQKKLDALGLDLGGGGQYYLLYFLTRLLNPHNVVETGVAAGWSSLAILTALKRNGDFGHLYSSDFPYFRYKNPEKYVGFVVDEPLKMNWSLYINGDENNLPRMIQSLDGKVALFHYDSDKSVKGRTFAYNLIKPHLDEKAIVIFDDIQDNLHFKQFTEENADMPYKIFEFEGKYIGLSGSYFK